MKLAERLTVRLVALLGIALAGQVAAAPPDFNGVWTGVTPPGMGGPWAIDTFSAKLPALTAWGQAKFDAAKPQRGPRGVAVAETDDLVYQCYPPGVPRIYLHPFPFEIVQTPARVLMVFEYDHLIRQIFTDGREHRTDLPPSWMGDSIGRFEGDTLVVDTDPKALAAPWEFTRYFKKTDWTIDELVCKDNSNFDDFENSVLEFKGDDK
jgi:hypothetical protein